MDIKDYIRPRFNEILVKEFEEGSPFEVTKFCDLPKKMPRLD